MSPEEVLFWMAGVEMPKANTPGLRVAAGDYRTIAGKLTAVKTDMDRIVADVAKNNKGDGPKAFEDFFAAKMSSYPTDVAGYANKIASSFDDLARVDDNVKSAEWVIAIQMIVNIAYTIFYGWATGWIEARMEQLVGDALFEKKILNLSVNMLLKRLAYIAADSVAYSVGQQGMQLATYGGADLAGVDMKTVKSLVGYDPFSLRDNAIQVADGFVGNVAFDTPNELLSGTMPKYFARRPGFGGAMAGLTSRLISSNAYTYASNITDSLINPNNNKDGWTQLPTWNQEPGKAAIHIPRIWIAYPFGKYRPGPGRWFGK